MAPVIPNLFPDGKKAKGLVSPVQAFIDTPAFIYSDWLTASGNSIGKCSAKVAVIGDGPAGASAAYELSKTGADVTLYTASTDHYGGRTYSSFFENADGSQSKDIAELGAMRFPPSQEMLFYYFKKFNIKTNETFPNPGKEPTLISYKGKDQLWTASKSAPIGFENVHKGFVNLVTDGIFKRGSGGDAVFASSVSMSAALHDVGQADGVTQVWQKHIDEFSGDSWYGGLRKIFGQGAQPWRDSAGTIWSDEDFLKFGTLGIGSGGFGPVYSISFLYIYRLLVNQLETTQLFVPGGISQLCNHLIDGLQKNGGKVVKSKVLKIDTSDSSGLYTSTLTLENGALENADEKPVFDYVIAATTTRAMELGYNLSEFDTDSHTAKLNPDTVAAINRTHVIPTSKFFIRTKKFWADGKYPRNLLSDTRAPQLYTLDYDEASDSGVVLAQYAWEDDSLKTLAFKTPEAYLALIKKAVREITAGSPYADYADQLIPYTGDMARDTRLISWENEPNYHGGFTLARPGQDVLIDTMFRDFAKAKGMRKPGSGDSGVYIAGDCTTWSGGWVEGALHSGLNVAAAIIQSSGGTFTAPDNTPITKVAPARYNYARGPQKD